MTEIVYSREVVALTEGQIFQNPRFFASPVAGADSVVVHGDWPAIVAAYEAADVAVKAIPAPAAPKTTPEPAPGDFGERADAFIAPRGFAADETVVLYAGADEIVCSPGGTGVGRTRKPK